MSHTDALQKKVESTARKYGLWRNLALLAGALLIALAVTVGWDGIAEHLKQHSEQALAEAGVDTQRIHVQLQGRQAQLKGFADTQQEADIAEQALKDVEGLSGIDNRIQVRKGLSLSTSALSVPHNAPITNPVITANAPATLPAKSTSQPVASTQGTTRGNVQGNTQSSVQGSVQGNTQLAPSPSTAKAPFATPDSSKTILLEEPADVAQIKAEWHNQTLTLKGALSGAREKADLMDAARRAFPNERIEDQITVQAGLDRADWLTAFATHLHTLKQGPVGQTVSMSSSAAGLAAKPEQVGSFIVRAPKAPGGQGQTPSAIARPTYRGDKPGSVATPAKSTTSSKPGTTVLTAKPTLIAQAPSTGKATPRRGHARDNPAKSASTAKPLNSSGQDKTGAAENTSASLHVRGQRGQMTVTGTLGSVTELTALNNALQLVWSPGTTLNLVQINNTLPRAPWLDGLNSSWLLLNQIEWLDLSASDKGISLSGWIINDDLKQRTVAALSQRVQPIPVRNSLRSIQGQSQSVVMARMLNNRYAQEALFVPGRAELAWAGQSSIDQIANMIRTRPEIRLVINVHEAGNGSPRQDLYLSQKRAQVIKDQLVTRGIARDRLMAVGHGNQYPVRLNQGPNSVTLVRRIEFTPL